MAYLLFIIYLLLFCWLITRIKFFKTTGLNNYVLVGLFLIRVAVMLVNGYVDLYHYAISDVKVFHLQGLDEYHLLLRSPSEYFTNIFKTGQPEGYGRFFESSKSFWNDTRGFIIVKMLSVFDIFSRGNFFVNALFYNFFIFFGSISFYKIFIKIFPNQKTIIIICVFLIPSTIYFTSSIHRDGLIYLALGMMMYHIMFFNEENRIRFISVLSICFYLFLILLLRNFVFLGLIPALIAWSIAQKKPAYSFFIFTSIYIIVIALFFSTTLFSNQFNLPLHFANRQADFIILGKTATSSIPITPLKPIFLGFLKNLPEAFEIGFLRPFIIETKNILYLPAAIELIIFEILFINFLFFRKKKFQVSPVIYFEIFFSITMILIIGYTIPILGPIVRYRSIYFPFLIIPIVCYTDWIKVKNMIRIK